MSRVLTFSQTFPVYHPRAGQPTYFVEKLWESIYLEHAGWEGFWPLFFFPLINSGNGFDIGLHGKYQPKHHTIRAGNRWKAGDKFSPRVWSGKPYQSKQIIIAPDIEVKKVWSFDLLNRNGQAIPIINGVERKTETLLKLAINDGLDMFDLLDWFKFPKQKITNFQIICWNEVNY